MVGQETAASRSALDLALGAHASVGYIAVSPHPEGECWSTISSLAARMPFWTARLTARTGGDPPATAAFLCGWAARAAVGLPVVLMATDGRALLARPEATFLRLADGGWTTGIAPYGARLSVDPNDVLRSQPGVSIEFSEHRRRRQVGETAAGLMEPIIGALAPTSGLAPRALWWLVADAVADSAVAALADIDAVVGFVDDVCSALPLLGTRRPSLQRVSCDGRPSLRVQRISCCFAYRTPDGVRCEDCPIPARPA